MKFKMKFKIYAFLGSLISMWLLMELYNFCGVNGCSFRWQTLPGWGGLGIILMGVNLFHGFEGVDTRGLWDVFNPTQQDYDEFQRQYDSAPAQTKDTPEDTDDYVHWIAGQGTLRTAWQDASGLHVQGYVIDQDGNKHIVYEE